MPGLMELLSYAGNALDLPASSLRDLFSGTNPFDQWATPFTSENRTSGRDMLNPIFGKNKETGMSGWLNDPMEGVADVLGFGAEMILDPVNLISGAGVAKVLKGRKAAKSANTVAAAENAANAGKYGYVNAKLAGQADELVNPITQQAPNWQDKLDELEFDRLELEREYSGKALEKLGRYAGPDDYDYGQGSIFDDITSTLAIARDPEYQQKFNQLTKQIDEIRSQNPMKRLGYTPERPTVYHGGHDWSASATPENPYGMFDVGRLKTGEGANAYGPGAYFADAESTSQHYRNIVKRKLEKDNPLEVFNQELVNRNSRYKYQDELNPPVKPLPDSVKSLVSLLEKNNWLGVDIRKHRSRDKLYDILSDGVGLDNQPIPAEIKAAYDSLEASVPKAKLYQLDAPHDFHEKLVDWHKPLGQQHYPVQSGLMESVPGLNDAVNEFMALRTNLGKARMRMRELKGYNPDYLDTPEGMRWLAAASQARNSQRSIAEDIARRTGLHESSAIDLLENADELTGEEIARVLLRGEPRTAPIDKAESVSKLGISGTKNLAASTGRNTYNYAIWNQDLLNKMRIRAIDGERVPINPTTLVQQVAKPRVQAADAATMQSTNPMRPIQQLPSVSAPVATTALYNILARQNNYGGVM